MNSFRVMASESLDTIADATAYQPYESTDIVRSMNYGWIIAIGLVLFSIVFVSIIVVPRILDYAMGIASVAGFLLIAASAILIPRFIDQGTVTQASKIIPPDNIQVTQIEHAVEISWQTEQPTVGGIVYGTSPDNLDSAVATKTGSQITTIHLAKIENLTPGETYYYQIISSGKRYPLEEPLILEIK